MAKYEIELTDTEDKAMSYACLSTQDWADNALKNRARIAIDNIVSLRKNIFCFTHRHPRNK